MNYNFKKMQNSIKFNFKNKNRIMNNKLKILRKKFYKKIRNFNYKLINKKNNYQNNRNKIKYK